VVHTEMYIRNADIIPNWSYICNNADIPKLYAIGFGMPKFIYLMVLKG
jgi:hypothetical protein